MKIAPGHRRKTDDRELTLALVPVVDHTLLVAALTGQAFISSDIDRRIWLSSLIQESVEISIVFQTSMVLPKLRGEEPTTFPPAEENARYVFGTRCHIAGPAR